MNIKNTIKQLYDSTPDYVHMVGFGQKITNGVNTGEQCIVFGLPKKKPKDQLDPNEILPSTVTTEDNIVLKTDVINLGPVELVSTCFSAGDPSSSYHRVKIRPLIGGVTLPYINNEFYIGTLGGIFKDKDDNSLVALTNCHVGLGSLANGFRNSNKTSIFNIQNRFAYQSNEAIFPPESDTIGYVKRYYPIIPDTVGSNKIDAGVISIDNLSDLSQSNSYKILGLFNQFPLPAATSSEIDNFIGSSAKCVKSGRTTGFIGGFPNNPTQPCSIFVPINNASVNIGNILFEELIAFSYSATTTSIDIDGTEYTVNRENVCVPGDSGSLLIGYVNGQYKIIGLVFAVSTMVPYGIPQIQYNLGYACRIDNVLDLLNLEAWDGNLFSVNPSSNWEFITKEGINDSVTITQGGKKYWAAGLDQFGSDSLFVTYSQTPIESPPPSPSPSQDICPPIPSEAAPIPSACCASDELIIDDLCCDCTNQVDAVDINWTITQDNTKQIFYDSTRVRVDFFDSQNCSDDPSAKNYPQSARLTGNFTLSSPGSLKLSFSGRVETQDSQFDKLLVLVDGIPAVKTYAHDDNTLCLMSDSPNVDILKPIIALSPGPHTINIFATTVDGLFHVDAYYEVRFQFETTTGDPCGCCLNAELTNLDCNGEDNCNVTVNGCVKELQYSCCDNQIAVRSICEDTCGRSSIKLISTGGYIAPSDAQWIPFASDDPLLDSGTYSFNPYPCNCIPPARFPKALIIDMTCISCGPPPYPTRQIIIPKVSEDENGVKYQQCVKTYCETLTIEGAPLTVDYNCNSVNGSNPNTETVTVVVGNYAAIDQSGIGAASCEDVGCSNKFGMTMTYSTGQSILFSTVSIPAYASEISGWPPTTEHLELGYPPVFFDSSCTSYCYADNIEDCITNFPASTTFYLSTVFMNDSALTPPYWYYNVIVTPLSDSSTLPVPYYTFPGIENICQI